MYMRYWCILRDIMYMGCPKALQNLALASDSIIGIIETIVSNFLIALSIINAFSSI